MNEQESYEKLIDYVERELVEGRLNIGDRLPAERELSSMLEISRGAIRIGLSALIAIGVVESKQGSGNYINGAFDHKLTQIMTMMYALDEMSQREIFGFRYAAEQEAILLATRTIDEEQKKQLTHHLTQLLSAEDPSVQTHHDQLIHQIIVEASNNRLVIARYMALNKILETIIRNVREKTSSMGKNMSDHLEAIHQQLVESICTNNYEKAKQALDDHYTLLLQTVDDETPMLY